MRRIAFGPEEQFVRPVGGYTAWFTVPDDVGLDGWFEMFNAPGGLVVSVRPDRVRGRVKAGLTFASPPLAYDRNDLAATRRLVSERFAGLGWRTPALLAAAATADDFYFDSITQIYLDRWSTGRVVLVGDAGYCPCPITGMGISLALVGAYVLAGELAAGDRSHEAAFAAYEARMRPYVRQGQKLPPGGIDAYAPGSAWQIRGRIMSTRLMASRPLRGLARRAFFSRADAIDLPDYPVSVAV